MKQPNQCQSRCENARGHCAGIAGHQGKPEMTESSNSKEGKVQRVQGCKHCKSKGAQREDTVKQSRKSIRAASQVPNSAQQGHQSWLS